MQPSFFDYTHSHKRQEIISKKIITQFSYFFEAVPGPSATWVTEPGNRFDKAKKLDTSSKHALPKYRMDIFHVAQVHYC